MDKNYNHKLDNFTTKLVHYDDYVDDETVANITEEPYGY